MIATPLGSTGYYRSITDSESSIALGDSEVLTIERSEDRMNLVMPLPL